MQKKTIAFTREKCKEGFHYIAKNSSQRTIKIIADTGNKAFDEKKSTTNAIEELNESFMDKNGVSDAYWTKFYAKLIKRENQTEFWLYDDPESENWN